MGVFYIFLERVMGLASLRRRQFKREWGEIQEYIEKEIKRREAAL